MRLVKNIPHHTFAVNVFNWNDKYIVILELGEYEQVYKVGTDVVSGLEEVESRLTEEFYTKAMRRFLAMREDWTTKKKA